MPNPMLELSQELECTLKKISTSAYRIYARKVCELSSTARVRTFFFNDYSWQLLRAQLCQKCLQQSSTGKDTQKTSTSLIYC